MTNKKRNPNNIFTLLNDMLEALGYCLIIQEKPKVEKSSFLIEFSENESDDY